MPPLCYRRHRSPPEIIQHAIWLYLRFTLSGNGMGAVSFRIWPALADDVLVQPFTDRARG